MKKNSYKWQPEMATAIIYWSCTFGILFLSLILTLEHTRPYFVSNIVFLIFVFFFFLGNNRYFKLEKQSLFIHALLPKKRQLIEFSSIEKIIVGKNGIEIHSSQFFEGSQLYMMTKKNKKKFIEDFIIQTKNQITIDYNDHLKMMKS